MAASGPDDGTSTQLVSVDYPIGHRKRRVEGIPLLLEKFENSVAGKLKSAQWQALQRLADDQERLEQTAVDEFVSLLVV